MKHSLMQSVLVGGILMSVPLIMGYKLWNVVLAAPISSPLSTPISAPEILPTATPTLTLTPTPQATSGGQSDSNGNSGGTSSGSGSSPSAPSCDDKVSALAPRISRVVTTGNTADLYVVAVGQPVSYYYVAYGKKANQLVYGGQFGVSGSAVLVFSIKQLKAATTYYFEVRAGNGCMPGPWSTVVKVSTTNSVKVSRSYTGLDRSLVAINKVKKSKIVNKVALVKQETTKVAGVVTTVAPTPNVSEVPKVTETQKAISKAKKCFLFFCW